MQRTYYIKHNTVNGIKFDKIVYKDKDSRPRWHKVAALTAWKESHKGYSYLRINSIFTIAEMKQNGYL